MIMIMMRKKNVVTAKWSLSFLCSSCVERVRYMARKGFFSSSSLERIQRIRIFTKWKSDFESFELKIRKFQPRLESRAAFTWFTQPRV